MIFSFKTIKQKLVLFSLFMVLPGLLMAEPYFVPGFFSVEMSNIEAPQAGMDSTKAYFSIRNVHPREPVLLLSLSSGMFEDATLVGANGEELEYVEVAPGELFVMGPNTAHVELSGVDTSLMAGDSVEVTLLIRRGREAMEPVEAEFDVSTRTESEAGIPNEKEFIVTAQVGH